MMKNQHSRNNEITDLNILSSIDATHATQGGGGQENESYAGMYGYWTISVSIPPKLKSEGTLSEVNIVSTVHEYSSTDATQATKGYDGNWFEGVLTAAPFNLAPQIPAIDADKST
ncbi:hypothetical protein [Pandoraea sp. PE-S2T-3]|uniref:hypothetical protein n=1 Tax=Pandoraea sp. PE-S2T-3 TaxID=1986993 RepID=UPI0011250510|nr:hypothetical protein [Pandoraea sp. PE-S2T-3]